MPNMITLAGLTVDQEDPCALKTVLELVRLKLSAGEQVEEYSIQSPTTRETVTFSPTNLAALNAEIVRLDGLCRAKNGLRCAPRRRLLRY